MMKRLIFLTLVGITTVGMILFAFNRKAKSDAEEIGQVSVERESPAASSVEGEPSAVTINAGGPADQALGRSRGGFSTKIHISVDGLGNPLRFRLTGGQRRLGAREYEW